MRLHFIPLLMMFLARSFAFMHPCRVLRSSLARFSTPPPGLIESTKKRSASVVPSRNRFLLCGAPHRLVSIMPQVFRVPSPASRQCSSTVSRELVGTIGSSDKYKDKNKWNKYEDGRKDKYKQELAQQHERPRVQPSSFILVSLKRR